MIDEGLFSAAGNAVLLAWLALVAAALSPAGSRYAFWLSTAGGRLVPISLSIAYLVIFCILTSRGTDGDLFSLGGIVAKFASSDHLFLLYLEVLTFSLFIGGWIVEDARRRSMPKWLVLFVLPIQFLFGPLGVLGYIASTRLKHSRPPSRDGD